MPRPSSAPPARAGRGPPRKGRCLVPSDQTRRTPLGVQERTPVAGRAQQLVHRVPVSLSAGNRLLAALARAQAALPSSRAETRCIALSARDSSRSSRARPCDFHPASGLPKEVSRTCSPLGLCRAWKTLVRPPPREGRCLECGHAGAHSSSVHRPPIQSAWRQCSMPPPGTGRHSLELHPHNGGRSRGSPLPPEYPTVSCPSRGKAERSSLPCACGATLPSAPIRPSLMPACQPSAFPTGR